MRLLWQIGRALWRAGLLRWPPALWPGMARAWWQCGPGFPLLVRLATLRSPHARAIVDDEGSLSFRELSDEVDNFARHLLYREQLQSGQRVALQCSNSRRFVLALAALTRLGVDCLPISPKLPPDRLEELLSAQGVELLLSDSELETQSRQLSWPTGTLPSKPLPRCVRPGQLIVLTSGTTGASKGIRRRPSLTQVLPVTAGLLGGLPLQPGRPIVLAIPLYHGYGIATLAMALALRAPLVLGRDYRVAPLLERSGAEDPPLLVTVPTLLHRWLREEAGTSRLAAIVTGSAPLSSQLCSDLLARCGPILVNLYGSTETGVVSMAGPEVLARSPGSVGRPLTGNEVRILSPEGQLAPQGATGEISVRGPLVLSPGREGWRPTGDLGYWDSLGHLHVCGRIDSMIVSGGENVFPFELERALLEHPDVMECAVLGVEDEEFGQRLAAAIVPRPGSSLDQEGLRLWLESRLERFKRPRSVHMMERLPRNQLGKIDQRQLRQRINRKDSS